MILVLYSSVYIDLDMFKKINTNIILGMRVNYNYCRKHQSLDGKTPSEKALINVDGKDKWFTLIQNASLNHIHE